MTVCLIILVGEQMIYLEEESSGSLFKRIFGKNSQ